MRKLIIILAFIISGCTTELGRVIMSERYDTSFKSSFPDMDLYRVDDHRIIAVDHKTGIVYQIIVGAGGWKVLSIKPLDKI